MKYKILEHTADLKIKVWGKDLPELFKNAAEAMFAAMSGKSEIRNSKHETNYKFQIKNLKLTAQDHESLLVNFLNELLYLSDVENRAYHVLDLEIRNLSLKAKLYSYPLPPLEIEIKGATYHNLKIKKINNIYETVLIFDI
jgi:SHS2 domain-containing protein